MGEKYLGISITPDIRITAPNVDIVDMVVDRWHQKQHPVHHAVFNWVNKDNPDN